MSDGKDPERGEGDWPTDYRPERCNLWSLESLDLWNHTARGGTADN